MNLDTSRDFFRDFHGESRGRGWTGDVISDTLISYVLHFKISQRQCDGWTRGYLRRSGSIVRTDRKGLAGFQRWNDRTVNTLGKRRCVTKRQGNKTHKRSRIESGRSREAFTFEHVESFRGCQRCPSRKWKQIARPRKSSHRSSW